MSKFKELPKRMFSDGDKKMFSTRLPEALLKQLKGIAQEKGWDLTDVVTTALDEYVQWCQKREK